MPSQYLVGSDAASYGVPNATPEQIQAASLLIDGHLKRGEGLVWESDAAGNPCFMPNKSPEREFKSQGAFSPGANVVVPLTTPVELMDGGAPSGIVVILDRENKSKREACIISASAPGSVTLQSVSYSHDANCTMEMGLTCVEERNLPKARSIVQVTRFPLVRLLSAVGRYSYGRRSDQAAGFYNDLTLVQTLSVFGGAPSWLSIDVKQCSSSPETGQIWIPTGIYMANYSEVRLHYIAGYSLGNVPSNVKQACANIIKTIASVPELAGLNLKSYQAGGTKIERFKDQLFSPETETLLSQYAAKLFF